MHMAFTVSNAAFLKNQIPAQTSNSAYTGAMYNQQGNLAQIYPQVGNTAKPVSMAYDAIGRVTSVSYGTSATRKTETYLYDDEGLRIRIFDGTTYKYNIYNEARQIIAQYEKPSSGSLAWKRSVVYVGTREIGEVDASGNSVTLSDHLGTPRYIWNGSTLIKQKFMPFGEQITDPNSANKFAKGFTGHEQTDLSNLNYMQARFYVPWYGKFVSPDPGKDQHFEFTQSWNVYSYTRNNPILLFDPNGTDIRYYFYNTTQSHSGAGHVGIAIGSGNKWTWYEASPLNSKYSAPMDKSGYRDFNNDPITGTNPDDLSRNSINGREFGEATAILTLKTSEEQDIKAIKAAEQFFNDNPNWNYRKANCADLGYTVAEAAGTKLPAPLWTHMMYVFSPFRSNYSGYLTHIYGYRTPPGLKSSLKLGKIIINKEEKLNNSTIGVLKKSTINVLKNYILAPPEEFM